MNEAANGLKALHAANIPYGTSFSSASVAWTDTAYKQIDVTWTPTFTSAFKQKVLSMIRLILRMAKRFLKYLLSAETWRQKRTWIGALILLRGAYIAMHEYGMSPFKKSVKDDHVFLTGAGAGIGRLMAVKLGQLGCKLSISDVNMAGLEETKDLCVTSGVPVTNICFFKCDMSKLESIKAGAETARAAFGAVTILINNAGIVSGKSTLELSDPMIDLTMRVNTISHL